MNKKVMYQHNSDHWATPKFIYDWYMENGFIDPCPLHSKENNLEKTYHNKKLFINPPYSDISSWVGFIKRNTKTCSRIDLLIPARTDTKYFHELLELCPVVTFIKGRLKFNDLGGVAPFPSIILIFFSNKSYFYNRLKSYSYVDQDFFKYKGGGLQI